jgi:molybdopterin-guanine dinucleotide biosynthesis protein A
MGTAAIVLAGGFSRRMGREKASLPWGETTLLEHAISIVEPVVDEVVVVLREGQPLPAPLSVSIARDPAEGNGPLAGLIAGLEAIRSDRAFLVSCDAPFLRPALVARLLELAQGQAAVVPVVEGRWMVTTAVYARSTLPVARELMAAGRPRPRFLAEEVGALTVPAADLLDIDPELASFVGCNTPEEYEAARRRAGN